MPVLLLDVRLDVRFRYQFSAEMILVVLELVQQALDLQQMMLR